MKPVLRVASESKSLVKHLSEVDQTYKKGLDKTVESVVDEAVKFVKNAIESQTLGELIITPGWIARKRKRELDPRVLVATGEYLRSIQKQRVSTGIWGIKCNIEKAINLELSSKGVGVPKKHWEPTLGEMKDRFPEIFAKYLLNEVFGGKT